VSASRQVGGMIRARGGAHFTQSPTLTQQVGKRCTKLTVCDEAGTVRLAPGSRTARRRRRAYAVERVDNPGWLLPRVTKSDEEIFSSCTSLPQRVSGLSENVG
jgi:hypothetical protein